MLKRFDKKIVMYKQTCFLFLVGLIFTNASAQEISIGDRNLKAYPRIENWMSIVVEGVACSSLYVKAKQGKIQKDTTNGKKCEFQYFPYEVGTDTFSIFKIIHKDTVFLSQRYIRVVGWPIPDATFANKKEGKISRGTFLASGCVSAHSNSFCGEHLILSYSIKQIRKGTLLSQFVNQGGRLSEENYKKLETIQSGDLIVIEDVLVNMPGQKVPVQLNTITLEIQ